MGLLAYFMRQSGAGAAIVASCVALGVFALGVYPLALELVVECTYPIDQVRGTVVSGHNTNEKMINTQFTFPH